MYENVRNLQYSKCTARILVYVLYTRKTSSYYFCLFLFKTCIYFNLKRQQYFLLLKKRYFEFSFLL